MPLGKWFYQLDTGGHTQSVATWAVQYNYEEAKVDYKCLITSNVMCCTI